MQNTTNLPVRERIKSLQGIRAIAFLGVFLYHAIRTFPGDGVFYEFFSTGLGPWGVSVFFVLSGFLMTYSYWNRPPQLKIQDMCIFAARKIKKLYPLHLIMLFGGSVYLLFGHQSFQWIIKRLIVSIPLMQTWFPSSYQAINSVAWYLSVSLFLYFVFPHILKFIKKECALNRAIVIIAVYLLQIVFGYCVARFTYIDLNWITYCHPLYRVGDFVIGGLIASFYVDKSKSIRVSTEYASLFEILALVFNVVACAFYSRVHYCAPWFAYTCLFTPASVMLIYTFSQDSGVISRLLNNKVVFWLADISPYGFLIHRIVVYYFQAFTIHVLKWEHTNFLLVVAVPFVCTVIATYFYLALEKKLALSGYDGKKDRIDLDMKYE